VSTIEAIRNPDIQKKIKTAPEKAIPKMGIFV
jgi:hypothetical protein